MDSSVPQQVVAPAEHRGVGELCAQIFLPKVGVRVEVHDAEFRVFLRRGAHRAEGHEMFPAEEEGKFSRVKHAARKRFD